MRKALSSASLKSSKTTQIILSIRTTLILSLLLYASSGYAQGSFRLGSQPSINLNKKLSAGYKLNLGLESRQTLYRDNAFNTTYDRTDISIVLSKKVGLSGILAGGYVMRFDSGDFIHRTTQQYTYVSNSRIRLAHRMVFDQTYSPVNPTQVRLRYRLSSLFPLNGDSIDPSEYYVKIQNQYTNAYQDGYDLEIALNIALGHKFSNDNKLEFGLDSRISDFGEDSLASRIWIRIGWFVVI